MQPEWRKTDKHKQRNAHLASIPWDSRFNRLFGHQLSSSLSFKSSLHRRFTIRQNGCRESCSDVNRFVSPRFKPVDSRRHFYWQWPVQKCKTRCLSQQPISLHQHHLKILVTVWIQSQTSSVLPDHVKYNMLKGYNGILTDDTKNKLPTSALNRISVKICHCEADFTRLLSDKFNPVLTQILIHELEYIVTKTWHERSSI